MLMSLDCRITSMPTTGMVTTETLNHSHLVRTSSRSVVYGTSLNDLAMEMHFTIPGDETPKASNRLQQAQRVPMSTGLGTAAANRPPSLLSRGKSFTSDDLLADEPNTKTRAEEIINESEMDEESDHSSSLMSAGLQKSHSSSLSNITNSPPSSLSSVSVADDVEIEADAVVDPFTPLHQSTFPASIHAAAATPKAQVGSSVPDAPTNTPAQPTPKDSNPLLHIEAATPRHEDPRSTAPLGRKTVHDRAQDGSEQSVDHKRQKVTSPSHGRGQSTSSGSGTGSTNIHDVFGSGL